MVTRRTGIGVRLRHPILLAISIISGVMFGGLAGTVWKSSPLRKAPAAQRSPGLLDLTMDQAGSVLRLNWDKNAKAIGVASHAVLTVVEEGRETKIGLTPDQLRSGTTTYSPVNSDVSLKLEVYGEHPQVAGSILFVKAPAKHSFTETPGEAPGRSAAPAAPAPAARWVVDDAKPPASVPIAVPVKNLDTTPALPQQPSAPPETNLNAKPLAVAKPEESRIATPLLDVPKGDRPKAAVTEPAREKTFEFSVAAEPVQGSRLGRIIGKVPLLGRLGKPSESYVPPKPLSKPEPVPVRPKPLTGPVDVNVEVRVSETGRVQGAELMDDQIVQEEFVWASLRSARQWVFEPARARDVPVESRVALHFHYQPVTNVRVSSNLQ